MHAMYHEAGMKKSPEDFPVCLKKINKEIINYGNLFDINYINKRNIK